jgi:hypothetical protein
MTANDGDEATLELLAWLPGLSSDPARADRTRRRCRALLNHRQHRAGEQVVPRSSVVRRRLAPVIIGAFCVFYIVYVGALVATTLRLQNLFR